MFSYSTPKEGNYAVLTPKFEQNDVRQIYFNGIRTSENDTYFDVYTCCTNAKRVAQYSETDRKYADIEVPANQVIRIRLIKKEYEVYGKKKTPTEFDKFFIEHIKRLCSDKNEAQVYGRLDMSSAMSSFIERVNASDDLSKVSHFYNELIEAKPLDKLPDELSDFKIPETKSYSGKSGYGGKSYGQKEGEKIEDKVAALEGLLDIYGENENLWNLITVQAGMLLFADNDVEVSDRMVEKKAVEIYLDLIKVVLGN